MSGDRLALILAKQKQSHDRRTAESEEAALAGNLAIPLIRQLRHQVATPWVGVVHEPGVEAGQRLGVRLLRTGGPWMGEVRGLRGGVVEQAVHQRPERADLLGPVPGVAEHPEVGHGRRRPPA